MANENVALDSPFHIDGAGQVAVLTDVQSQLALRVRSIIGTAPGERVMRPTYGSGAGNFLFDIDDAAHAARIVGAVTDALNAWEPAIVVENVGLSAIDPQNGALELSVSYRLASTGEVQTTTVTVAATATYGWPAT